MSRFRVWSACWLILIAAACTSQPSPSAPATRPATEQAASCEPVANTHQHACTSPATGLHYWLYLPAGSTTHSLPLLIYLHGFSRSGSELNMLLPEGLPFELSQGRTLPMIVVSPQCPSGDNWQFPGMIKRLSQFVRELTATYPVDPARVILTGFSMGGDGVWAVGITHPEQFQALAPVASWYDTLDKVCAVRDLPVWVFQSESDEVVAAHYAKEMVSTLKRCGGKVRLTLYPQGSHEGSARQTYHDDSLYAWMLDPKVE